MAPLIVTGFVPIKNPRPEEEYRRLGRQLTALPDVQMFEHPLEYCWLFDAVGGRRCTHMVADNPAKNTLGFHIVQHQKTEWLHDALGYNREADPLVWIDYGIFHLSGVTPAMIHTLMVQLAIEPPERITAPGCWAQRRLWDDHFPCWRFCGGLLVCPRLYVDALDALVKLVATRRLIDEQSVTWEVNTWAHVERMCPEIFDWYQADHDATMFTNYGHTG